MFSLNKKEKFTIDPKLTSAVIKARGSLAAATEKMADLERQRQAAEADLKLLDAKLMLAGRVRDEALDKFVAREINESERDKAIDALQALRLKRETAAGVLAACEKAITAEKSKIEVLKVEVRSTESVFWRNMHDLMKREIEGYREAFLRANTAMINAAPGAGYFSWNDRVFDQNYGNLWPNQAEMMRCTEELEAEFLK